MLSQGIVTSASLAQAAQHDDYPDNCNPQCHGERIGTDETVLHATQPSRHPTNRSRRAVHSAIDSGVLEPDKTGGEPLPGTHEHCFVEGVAVEIVTSGQGEERPALRLAYRNVATWPEDQHTDPGTDGNHHQGDECDGREVQQTRRLLVRPAAHSGIKPANDPV